MNKRFIGFDLEIAKIAEGSDWAKHRPFGITCASAVADDLVLHWEAKNGDEFTPQMTQAQCQEMVMALEQLTHDGYSIVTWNGLRFDFDVLQEESGLDTSQLAMGHIDIMFQFFCMTGFPVGMDTVAKTMGLHGKTEGMSGSIAPEMWTINPMLVIGYVIQDGRTTLEVANLIEKAKRIAWTTKKGKFKTQEFPQGLLSVRDCLSFPLPDQTWMKKPMTRESYMEWMNKGEAVAGNATVGDLLKRSLDNQRPNLLE